MTDNGGEVGVLFQLSVIYYNKHFRNTKIDKTKVLTTNGSLMKVENIAGCSKRVFCNTFDLH